MLPASSSYPRGEPALTGQYTPAVQCARCGITSSITPAEYSRMPSMTLGDFERLAREYGVPHLALMPTKDLAGSGFPEHQARDLFTAGFLTAEDPDCEYP